MKALTCRGRMLAVSTRDLNGSVLLGGGNAVIDVGEAGSGYRVYTNGGKGPVDFARPAATLSTNARHWRRNGLSHPGSWRFVVRAFNEAGSELNLDRGVTVELDEAGLIEAARPNAVTSLTGEAAEGGKVELHFTHDRSEEESNTTHFHVYHDNGTGTIDYGAVRTEIIRAEGRAVRQVYVSTALADGTTYRFAVRAANAEDIEDDGKQFVEVAADADAPEQPEELTGGVTH